MLVSLSSPECRDARVAARLFSNERKKMLARIVKVSFCLARPSRRRACRHRAFLPHVFDLPEVTSYGMVQALVRRATRELADELAVLVDEEFGNLFDVEGLRG